MDFLPHLIPMTRGILAAWHVRPTRPTSQSELDDLYAAGADAGGISTGGYASGLAAALVFGRIAADAALEER